MINVTQEFLDKLEELSVAFRDIEEDFIEMSIRAFDLHDKVYEHINDGTIAIGEDDG